MAGYQNQNTAAYGARLVGVSGSTTDYDVSFQQFMAPGPTYGSTASAINWGTTFATAWRVRKAKASAPVGFSLAGTDGSSGLYMPGRAPGLTTGAAVPAGMIGERITWTSAPGNQALTTTMADWTNATFTLTPGVWQIFGSFFVTGTTATSTGAGATIAVQITDASNTVVQNMESQMYIVNSGSSALTIGSTVALYGTVSISANTTYKVRFQKAEAAATCLIYNTTFARSVFYAIRIA